MTKNIQIMSIINRFGCGFKHAKILYVQFFSKTTAIRHDRWQRHNDNTFISTRIECCAKDTRNDIHIHSITL